MDLRAGGHGSSAEETLVTILRGTPAGAPKRSAQKVVEPRNHDHVGFIARRHRQQSLTQRRRHQLVGIEEHDPVAGRLLQRKGPGWVGIAQRLMQEDPRTEALGYRPGGIAAVHVHDDDLVHPARDRPQRKRESLLLVERIQHGRDSGARGGVCPGSDVRQ